MTRFDDWLAEQAAHREEHGLTRRLLDSDRGEPLLDLAGNDYLGLARDRRVIEGAVRATAQFGTGAGASRLVSGTLSIHTILEHALAEFMGFPAALVFSTGYHANLSAVSALADEDTLVVSDAHVHASMIDACRLARRDRDARDPGSVRSGHAHLGFTCRASLGALHLSSMRIST